VFGFDGHSLDADDQMIYRIFKAQDCPEWFIIDIIIRISKD